jgi:hypothetical protein
MTRALLLFAYAVLSVSPTVPVDPSHNDQKSKPLTVSGCLTRAEEHGVYRVKSPAGNVEVRGAAQLDKYVGRKVKVTGVWVEDVGTVTGREEDPIDHSHLNAGKVKDVARTCDSTR